MGLAHFPDLVTMDQADAGTMAPSRFEAVNQGWVQITRPWHLLTTNSGAGDPRPATAAQGRGPDRDRGRTPRGIPDGTLREPPG